MQFKLLIGMMLLALGLASANAIIMDAGINFQNNAFSDTVISSSGNYSFAGAATLSAAVTGSSLTKYAFDNSPAVGDSIQLGFTDNYLVNGAGNDLVVFTIGLAKFSVTLNGLTQTYTSQNTFFPTTIGGTSYPVYAAQINLDDFGAAAGAQFSSILIGMGVLPTLPNNMPVLSVVAALNSAPANQMVPEAGPTISMLGVAIAGLGLLNRKLSKNFRSER
jgi:hypothetical protein